VSDGLEEFVSKQLPQTEDKEFLKVLLGVFKSEGTEAVKEKIMAMIDELKGV
jgi:hypothetical protein